MTANYAAAYSVTAAVSPAGTGAVSIAPSSADGYFPANSNVALTATPASGYCFAGWMGLVSGTPASTTLTVTQPYALQANFSTGGSVSLSSTVAYVASSGGTVRFTVAGSGCPWSAQTSSAWIGIVGGSGTGTSTVTLNIAPNPGVWRLGRVVVGNATFSVLQIGR
jgi:hypothetical protein